MYNIEGIDFESNARREHLTKEDLKKIKQRQKDARAGKLIIDEPVIKSLGPY